MVMTEVKTEKVMGIIQKTETIDGGIIIGYNASNGTKIIKGILSFEYEKVRDSIRNKPSGSATSATINLQQPSFFTWKLRLMGDCRQAFFATDVQAAAGNQFALVDNNFSNKIEYFKVIVAIEDANGIPKARTYTITNGYVLRNRTYIGDHRDAVYEYEGEAEYISYSDA